MHRPKQRPCQQHTSNTLITQFVLHRFTKHLARTDIFENKRFATTVAQQRQQVDAAGCRTFSLVVRSAHLPLIFCKLLVGTSRFVVRAGRPPAAPKLGARSEDTTPSLGRRNSVIPPQISKTIDGSAANNRAREYPDF
jgi:hypothetical protein